MNKITVVISRNASYQPGMYGLSIHDQPGGAANVQPINSEEELRGRLSAFGLSDDYVEDILERLKNKHDSVKLAIDSSLIDAAR